MVKEFTKILIVEDNDFDLELIERKLGKVMAHYETMRASSVQEYKDGLQSFSPHLILSDFSIPSYDGFKALKFAKTHYPDVPFIFVTGSIGEELAVETLIQGANDYVIKDNLNKLVPSVKRALNEVKEKTKRRIAEEKLKVKNNELRTLIYRISHDIKAPVCSMQGAINLYKLARDKEECLKYINVMDLVTGKLDGIIKNLSNFQYIFADEIQSAPIDLQVLLEEIRKSISFDSLPRMKLKMELVGEQNVYCEKHFLLSIIYNLLHNSIIFSDESKAVKSIHCIVNNTKNNLLISVEDNGIGIPENVKDRVCEMFYRGSQVSQGAGLGLYIVKTCTELLEGKLEIESTVGIDTKVKIRIPHPAFNLQTLSLSHQANS